MGGARREVLRVDFDRSIKLEFQGARVSSDSRLLRKNCSPGVACIETAHVPERSDMQSPFRLRHKMTRWFLAVGLLLFCGCGTWMARSGWRYEGGGWPRYYPATWWDLQALDPSQHLITDQLCPKPWGYLIDLPVSLATDTICLPLDLLSHFDKGLQIDDAAWSKLRSAKYENWPKCPRCGEPRGADQDLCAWWCAEAK